MNPIEQKQAIQKILDEAGVKFGEGVYIEPFANIKDITIQYVKAPRKEAWNNEAHGLVVRVRTKWGILGDYLGIERWFKEFFNNHPCVTLRSTVRSEKLRKGSGYWGARSYQHASAEYYTSSFWISLEE